MLGRFRRVDGKAPLICGHRGNCRHAPENTRAALQATLDAGGNAAEIDAVLSVDGRIVIFHDLLLDRTSNGSGAIADTSYEELRVLDAGAWFSSDFTGEPIPTLEDVLAFAHEHDVMLELEIKEKRNLAGMINALTPILADPVNRERIMLLSFDHVWLDRLKDIIPSIQTAGILQSRLGDPLAAARSARLDQLSIDFSVFDPDQARSLRENGLSLRCHAYDPDKIAQLEQAGLGPRAKLTAFLREGLIDTLSGDDVGWVSRLVDEALG